MDKPANSTHRVAKSRAAKLEKGGKLIQVMLTPAEAQALDRIRQDASIRDTIGDAILHYAARS